MNGIHDLGGMDGFGPIERDTDAPVFESEWERRVFALFLPTALASGMAVDEFRHAIEHMEPATYLRTSYYEHWLHAFEATLLERGLVAKEELAAGRALAGRGAAQPALRAADVAAVVASGSSSRRDAVAPPRFRRGQAVRARNLHPRGHTRLPRYVRGVEGCVVEDRGVFAFPDAVAHGRRDAAERVYSVRFLAGALWGEEAARDDALYIDLFEPYLEEATGTGAGAA